MDESFNITGPFGQWGKVNTDPYPRVVQPLWSDNNPGPPKPDPRDAEIARLRERVRELEALARAVGENPDDKDKAWVANQALDNMKLRPLLKEATRLIKGAIEGPLRCDSTGWTKAMIDFVEEPADA